MSALTNPPAFPRTQREPYRPDNNGMSLRDYFASAALPQAMSHAFGGHHADYLPEEWAAKIAYAMADAMLAARGEQ